MASDHETPAGVKLGVGVGVAFLLYWLFGRDKGSGPGVGPGTSLSPVSPAAPAIAPTRLRDTQPVEILVHPSVMDPARTVIEMEGRIVTLSNLIARIDAGKRRDVRAMVRGDTREGGWTEIRDALEFAGIQILKR